MSDLISNYECTQQPSRSNAPGLVPSLALPKHVDWGWCTLLRSAVVAVPTHFSTNRRSAKETCTNITVAGLNSDNNGYNHTGTVAISSIGFFSVFAPSFSLLVLLLRFFSFICSFRL